MNSPHKNRSRNVSFSENVSSIDEAPAHQKYVFKPFEGSSHSWALKLLSSLPLSSRIIDIGAGGGGIGSALHGRGFTALTAVEPDNDSRARLARFYTNTFSSVAEAVFENEPHDRCKEQSEAITTSLKKKSSPFDVALLLDVLEHVYERESFLHDIVSLMRPGGTILVSVPNIAHWSTRLSLFFGRFEYASRGILDRTHVRLYTRRSISSFLRSFSSLEVVDVQGSIVPIELLLPMKFRDSNFLRVFAQVRSTATRVVPGLFSYQILVHLKVRK
jgi:2-polyprenyl-3-methyl-5-hydroxy-6-metoxy-1,4-benzoquinol methylase